MQTTLSNSPWIVTRGVFGGQDFQGWAYDTIATWISGKDLNAYKWKLEQAGVWNFTDCSGEPGSSCPDEPDALYNGPRSVNQPFFLPFGFYESGMIGSAIWRGYSESEVDNGQVCGQWKMQVGITPSLAPIIPPTGYMIIAVDILLQKAIAGCSYPFSDPLATYVINLPVPDQAYALPGVGFAGGCGIVYCFGLIGPTYANTNTPPYPVRIYFPDLATFAANSPYNQAMYACPDNLCFPFGPPSPIPTSGWSTGSCAVPSGPPFG